MNAMRKCGLVFDTQIGPDLTTFLDVLAFPRSTESEDSVGITFK